MTRYVVLLWAALAMLVGSACGQALLDQAVHGNCAAGTVRGSSILHPTALFIRCGTDPTVFLIGLERFFGHPNRDGAVMGFKTEQTKRMAQNAHARDLGRFARTLVRFRFDDGDWLAITGRVSADGFLYTTAYPTNQPASIMIRNAFTTLRQARQLHLSTNGEPSGTIDLQGGADAYEDWRGRLDTPR